MQKIRIVDLFEELATKVGKWSIYWKKRIFLLWLTICGIL